MLALKSLLILDLKLDALVAQELLVMRIMMIP